MTPGVSPGRDSVVRSNKNRPVLAVYIYQDQRFKGQDEFLGGNVAGGPAGRRCLRKTNDFQRITATRRERVSRIYTNFAETIMLLSTYRFLISTFFAIVINLFFFLWKPNTD